MNYYTILGVSPNATVEEIKHAYLKLAKQYHPDKNKSPSATEKMAEINLAYETLCNVKSRREYNVKHDILSHATASSENPRKDYSQERWSPPEPQYISCPNCGYATNSGDRFCPGCGIGLSFRKCTECSFINRGGDLFVCMECGHPFEPTDDNDQSGEGQGKQASDDEPQDVSFDFIKCPQCNSVNLSEDGICNSCGLHFES